MGSSLPASKHSSRVRLSKSALHSRRATTQFKSLTDLKNRVTKSGKDTDPMKAIKSKAERLATHRKRDLRLIKPKLRGKRWFTA